MTKTPLEMDIIECPTDEQIPVQASEMLECATDDQIPVSQGGIHYYLDRAVGVLQKFGVAQTRQPTEFVKLLGAVKPLNEAKLVAIAKTVQQLNTFNQCVRDSVESIGMSASYLQIVQMLDSIREDSKMLIKQLDDGKLSFAEKATNLWMRIRRGTPSARFEKIAEVYKHVSWETKHQLAREVAIVDAYIDFRFALKEAEILAREVLDELVTSFDRTPVTLTTPQHFSYFDAERTTTPESQRHEHSPALGDERRATQLLKEITENLSLAYELGETLITKLKQTHDVRDKVYRRSDAFFTTNEHVFKALGTVYTSNQGSSAPEATKIRFDQGIDDVSGLGRELERAALKAGYGSTISPSSVERLVAAISDYQVDSTRLIAELRAESEANAMEIRRVVEEGKRRFQETVSKFSPEFAK